MPKLNLNGQVVRGKPAPHIPQLDQGRRLSDWLAGFMDYTSELECPANYLRWVGLSTIAGAAQRKIYMESQAFFAHTNMYVVLVGPPGSKKSTAIRAGRRLLKQVPGVNLSSDAPSVVGLMQDFKDITSKDHQSLNGFISEMSTLFENASETMTGFLTAIYDGDPDYIKRTRLGGVEHIPFPWFNMVAGTTPSWLGDNLRKSAVEGGLVARTIYVHSDEVILKSPFPRPSPALRVLEEKLVHDLAMIATASGEFDFEGGDNGEAYRWYETWYMDRRRLPLVADNRTAGYFTRKPIHLLKVAMAVSLARSNALRITQDNLELALALLDKVEPGMRRAFSAVGGNTYATDLERVHAQIRGCGTRGLTYPELVANNYHQMEQKKLDEALVYLKAMGRVAEGFTVSPAGNIRRFRALDLDE